MPPFSLTSYAKALHYKEQEFHENKNTEVLETLIMTNNKLQQKEAAQGLLEYVLANRSAVEEPKVRTKSIFAVRIHRKKYIIFEPATN